MLKVLSVFGTRPEAIKMAPVAHALATSHNIASSVCVTAQHKTMLHPILDFFAITPDFDLDIMANNQSLNGVLGKMVVALDVVMQQVQPDVVLVQGDTVSCFAGALAAFNSRIAVAHVEAGLRTGLLNKPYPEEGYRQMVSRIARLHFAPTQQAADHLQKECLPHPEIVITGNTSIDALYLALQTLEEHPEYGVVSALPSSIAEGKEPFILVTGHRRESFGDGFLQICQAIKELASMHPSLHIVYPVHLNPHVQKPVQKILQSIPNIHLIPPQGYPAFVTLMRNCLFILTDSGGVQEEAPALNKPVLVMRDVTERPEALQTGAARLVGTTKQSILYAATTLLTDASIYNTMKTAQNPYGDGNASIRICQALQQALLQ